MSDDDSEALQRWVPYRSALSHLEEMMVRLHQEKEMYRMRCVQAVVVNDAANAEIEHLRARLRAKTDKMRKEELR